MYVMKVLKYGTFLHFMCIQITKYHGSYIIFCVDLNYRLFRSILQANHWFRILISVLRMDTSNKAMEWDVDTSTWDVEKAMEFNHTFQFIIIHLQTLLRLQEVIQNNKKVGNYLLRATSFEPHFITRTHHSHLQNPYVSALIREPVSGPVSVPKPTQLSPQFSSRFSIKTHQLQTVNTPISASVLSTQT